MSPIQKMRNLRVKFSSSNDQNISSQWQQNDVFFAANSDQMATQHQRAITELFTCIKPTVDANAILNEGGVYLGCWLESTGTINTEILARFLPDVATATFLSFAKYQREDGLLPYKLTADGPAFSQIQLVTPPARSVWKHYKINGLGKEFLTKMYQSLCRYDDWLAKYRDTRGSGGVEAFGTYDTGHDLSCRFWHMPDSPLENDASKYNLDNPLLPLIAPDLTAAVACHRLYLAKMATELGLDSSNWKVKSDASIAALFDQCYDAQDGFFYDRDRNGNMVKVQSDVLLRVFASEIGDDALFDTACRRYFLNTAKFFAKYPFPSIALDDPRYDPTFDHNSWGGPSNFLSIIRAPEMFETHHRHVELTWVLYPILSALFKMKRFAQTLSPLTGVPGFTEIYSPTILCLLDFVERLCGIQPRPDGTLWITGLVPYKIEHKDESYETAYGRRVDGTLFELENGTIICRLYKDGALWATFPKGLRLVTDYKGNLQKIVGLSVREIEGRVEIQSQGFDVKIKANEQWDLVDNALVLTRNPGLIPPSY